jgi:hypothetical protein
MIFEVGTQVRIVSTGQIGQVTGYCAAVDAYDVALERENETIGALSEDLRVLTYCGSVNDTGNDPNDL